MICAYRREGCIAMLLQRSIVNGTKFTQKREASPLFRRALLRYNCVRLRLCMLGDTSESFYGSPLNYFSSKSLVLKPDPGCISGNTVPSVTPTTSLDCPGQERRCLMMYFFIASVLVSSGHETFVKENR